MIWNFIRDFIVENITGGYNSNLDYFSGSLGYGFNLEGNEITDTEQLAFNVGYDGLGKPVYFNVGDWLATTLTIICMCLIVAFAIWLVIWVFKAVAHAFLLRR